MGLENYVQRTKGVYFSSREHARDYCTFPRKTFIYDFKKIFGNLKDKHPMRMASLMGFTGVTMPLKAWLETSGKSINSWAYGLFPDAVQNFLLSFQSTMPEFITRHIADFSTSGQEMSDLDSIAARGISLVTAYFLAEGIIPAREYIVKKSCGQRTLSDFGTAAGPGAVWEWIKYSIAQGVTGGIDNSQRTNAIVATILPTALLHTIRGWFLDFSKDLVGEGKYTRFGSKYLEKISPRVKKNIFRASVATSFLTTGAVYVFWNNTPFR